MISSEFLSNPSQSIHIKLFEVENAEKAVLLIHGSLEDGRIFYSKSNKGLAPFLQNQGYNVHVPDFQGRGKSSPHPKRLDKGHDDIILEDIPLLIDSVYEKYHKPMVIMCHSWGGVLLMGAIARKPELSKKIKALVFFGTKRHISVKSLRKYWFVDILWSGLGLILTQLYGYLPANKLKFGSADETRGTFIGTKDLVYKKNWIGEDGFDYRARLIEIEKPPALFIAGILDYYLGHPKDVARFIKEVGYKEDDLKILSRSNGASLDYGHIDMLTSPKAKADIFETVINWLQGI